MIKYSFFVQSNCSMLSLFNHLKNTLYYFAFHSGFNQLLITRAKNRKFGKLILNYHHILPTDQFDDSLVYGYSHSEEAFRAQLSFLCQNFLIDTDLHNPESICITFDDGPQNNAEFAIPILNEFNIKAWFFINDRLSDHSTYLWIDQWYTWFSYAPQGSYTFGKLQLDLSHESRIACEIRCFNYLLNNYDQKEALMHELEGQFNNSSILQANSSRFQPLTSAQIIALKEQGHSIGFHTNNHEWLAALQGEELQKELTPSSELSELITDKEIISLPFGFARTYSQNTLDACIRSGFKVVLLNEPNSIDAMRIGRINLPNTLHIPTFSSHLAAWPQHLNTWR